MKPVEKKDTPQQELIDELASGARRMHQLPEELDADSAAEARRRAIESVRGVELGAIASYSLDAERATQANCENFIGACQIPVGVIGPLSVRGECVSPDEILYVPLATTEGALIASTNRGCAALRRAGGAIVRVEDVGITRAPVFRTSGIEETRRFLEWIAANEERIRREVEATSGYLKLIGIRPHTFGSSVYLRFRFSCGDAMGMNMATIACDRVVRGVIEPEAGVACVALSGNYCVDKKPSAINFLEGRGKRLYAEVTLDKTILASSLKTTARKLVEVQYRKNLMGSIAAGAIGSNAHFANVLAAFFTATGQDLAQVVDGIDGGDLYRIAGPRGSFRLGLVARRSARSGGWGYGARYPEGGAGDAGNRGRSRATGSRRQAAG